MTKPISDERRAELRDWILFWTNWPSPHTAPGNEQAGWSARSDLLALLDAPPAPPQPLAGETPAAEALGQIAANHPDVAFTTDDLRAIEREFKKPAPTTYRLRPEVGAFADLMEGELRKHDNRPGWKECDPEWLMARLKEEAAELARAILSHEESIPAEAADVANFAMMIADVEGGLGPPAPPAPKVVSRDFIFELCERIYWAPDIASRKTILAQVFRDFGHAVEPEESK